MNDRYSRHIMLPEIGIEGQLKLSHSRVLIVGMGGLGSPISLYLTAAGIGCIGIIDHDVVSESNLQRQILYTTSEVGLNKTECAYIRLHNASPQTAIQCYTTMLDENNAEEIISGYDIVVDGCDNALTRYIIDEVCAQQGKPYVYGSVCEYSGQVSVFDARYNRRYIDLYPDREHVTTQPPITQGIVSSLPGIVGCIEATETIKLLTEVGEPLIGKLFVIDVRTMQTTTLEYK